MKKLIIPAVIILVLAISIFWLGQKNNETKKQKVKISYIVTSINHAPIMIALEKDLFTKYGLDFEATPLNSGDDVRQGISVGQIDIGTSSATGFFAPISKGIPVKIISPMATAASRIYVRPDSGIETLADLRGKKMALTPRGTEGYSVNSALLQEGIDPTSIEFLEIEKAYKPIALMQKKTVDAVGVGEVEQSIYEEAGAILLKEWETKGYLESKFPRAAIALNTNFSAKNYEAIDKFLDALIEAHKFIKENPEEAAELVANHINQKTAGAIQFTTEDVLETWESTRYFLWVDPEISIQMSRVAKEFGEIDRELSEEELFDLRFKDKLQQAQLEIYGK